MTKTVTPTNVTSSATTTYTIAIRNGRFDRDSWLRKIVDTLPLGFTYVSSSISLTGPDGAPVSISDSDLTVSGRDLTWTLPSQLKIGPLETVTSTFSALAAIPAGVYCNEAYGMPGGEKTRSVLSGAKVTVGTDTGQTLCDGTALSITKTVTPDVVFGNTATRYTYVIKLVNEGTLALSITELRDYIGTEFTYVPLSISSTPLSMNPGDPDIKVKTRSGVSFNRFKWVYPSSAPQVLNPGATWLVEFKADATLPRGFYANEVELRLDHSRFRLYPSEIVEAAADTEYTYRVVVENDGTEIMYVEEVKVTPTQDLAYLAGTATSTAPYHSPVEPQRKPPDYSYIEWVFDGSGVQILPGETWTLTFKVADRPIISVDVEALGTDPPDFSIQPTVVATSTSVVTYTYVAPVTNNATSTLEVKNVLATPNNSDLLYLAGSTTSTSPYHSPVEPTQEPPGFTHIKWGTFPSGVSVTTSTPWNLTFQVTKKAFATAAIWVDWQSHPDDFFDVLPTSVTRVGTDDVYTLDVSINLDDSVARGIRGIRVTMDDIFTYQPGSSTSTSPYVTPVEPKYTPPGYAFFAWEAASLVIQPNATITLSLKVATPAPGLSVPVDVVLTLNEDPDDEKPADRVSGPTAVVTSMDVFTVTIFDGLNTITCTVWLASDIDLGDFTVVEGCGL